MKAEYEADSFTYLTKYLNYLWNIKGRSEKTVDEYYISLRLLFRFLKLHKGLVTKDTEFDEIRISDIDEKFLKSVTLDDLYSFLNFTSSERSNIASTRARKVSSIKGFFNYLKNKALIIEENPAEQLESPKKKKSLPHYLTLEQSIELLNAVDGEFKERDYCILTLFLNCGMRLSELVGINYGDINTAEKTLRLTGKGNKERIIYINDACIDAINKYLKVRPVDGVKDKKALFISRQLGRISPKTVQAMVYKYLEKIGLDSQGYSVHKLRHTAATLMYQHGNVDIRVLKEILGHENLGTTEIYTHIANESMQRAAQANPLANVKKRKN